MSREAYNSVPALNPGTRSPGRASRRLTELPTVDRSPSREYEYNTRGSPLGNDNLKTKNKYKITLLNQFNSIQYNSFLITKNSTCYLGKMSKQNASNQRVYTFEVTLKSTRHTQTQMLRVHTKQTLSLFDVVLQMFAFFFL